MLFVNVRTSLQPLDGGVVHHLASSASMGVTEDAALPRPGAGRKPQWPELGDAKLNRALQRLAHHEVVDGLLALKARDPAAFGDALHAVLGPDVLTDFDDGDTMHFAITVARNFLSDLVLTPNGWLRLVIVAALAHNNAVLSTAVKRAQGCDAAALAGARAWVQHFGESPRAALLERALTSCAN